MNWIGKVGGGLLGFIAGGPVGAAVGALLGHQFDRGLGSRAAGGAERPGGAAFDAMSAQARQRVFFESTFLVMGHLAKADGRVSEQEIQAARSVMHRMQLRPEDVRRAIDLFTAGKAADFRPGAQARKLRLACGFQPALLRTFMEIQLDLALSKGQIAAREREVLWMVAGELGIGRVELAQLEALMRASRSFRGGGRSGPAPRARRSLDEAYKALGLDSAATDREVKTAYRRLLSQHHPDKLASRGLPESMLEVAKERTREIRSAYEVIRDHRGLK